MLLANPELCERTTNRNPAKEPSLHLIEKWTYDTIILVINISIEVILDVIRFLLKFGIIEKLP